MEAGAWPFLQPYAALVGLRDERQTLLAAAACMAVTGALTFLSLQLTVAPYGKYASSAGWWYGFKMPGKLAWMLQEAPAALWACWGCWVWCFAKPHASGAISSLFTTPQGILLAMFTFHYMNRAFVFPMRLRGGKPTPFVVFLMALFFCAYNGYMICTWLAKYDTMPASAVWEPHFVIGVIIFFVGMALNWQADAILINLRKPGETGYKIPYGGLFELVSGANFFGEILEWAGFALAAWSLPTFAFAFFTFCNTAPRGAAHHEWYKQKFEDYPRSRKAVIPFIW